MLRKIKATPKKKQNTPAGPQIKSFPIVGIGGSAGGLEAFQKLLTNISDKPGAALVFIMHLTPGHKSLLPELLAAKTKMPVSEIANGMILEINHVYIKPSGTNLSMANGKLILSVLEDEKVKRMPIDYFFRSLAEELGNRSIGVILSGTATDGTLGAGAIKAAGGITFAEDEKSAAFYDMPKSAIAAGSVDFVLSPARIAGELERIARHPLISSAALFKTEEPIVMQDKGFEGIFDILRRAKGLDFTYYKPATITRRISRRIVLTKQGNLKSYIKFLREDKDEIGYLYEDLLINVTNFFRDQKAFQALEKLVIPKILKNKTKDQGVRIWVSGCSSGEEAYSIAILLTEALGRNTGVVPVSIFATDMSDIGINRARRGIYSLSIKEAVSPARLKKFFTKEGNSYKISKSLREMCVFSKQNVFSDPPFSNIDLVSCRNLLIYLQPMLQKRAFHNFHYSLKPNGFLFLGNSESAAGYANLFKDLDRKQKIFVKKYVSIRPGLELGQKYYPTKKLEVKEKIVIDTGEETDIVDIADRIVLNEYAPCGVLIDGSMGIVRFRGHTGRFLESAAGRPSLDIFKLAREGLLLPLRSAIHKARKTKHTVKREASNVLCNGRKISVMVTAIPLKSAALEEEFFLVLFDEITKAAGGFKNLPKAPRGISLEGRSIEKDGFIKDLEKELVETKEYLQTVIEEQGNVNEELKTANEEILSSNEELQSTNEELETAKEELQSSNEELTTTNEELENRNAEVSVLNNDLINLLSSINIPVVMMGVDLVIRRVTPQADKVLNITSSDVGRPISKVKLNIDIPDLEKTLFDVIESLHPKTFEIKNKEGNWYSVYIRPYRTMDNKIDGVVVIFIDITERKNSEQIVKQARDYAENIVETMAESLIVLDNDLKVVSANKSFCYTFKVNIKETKGCFIYDLGNKQWDIPKLRQLLEDILVKKTTIEGYEISHRFESIGQKTMLFNARRLTNMNMILITIEDITEHKKAEERIAWLASFPELYPLPICEVDTKGEITYINPYMDSFLPDLRKLGLKHPWLAGIEAIAESFYKGEKQEVAREVKIASGVYEQNIFYISALERLRIYGFDITIRKRMAEVLQESIKTKSAFTSMVSHELRTPLSALKESVSQVLDGMHGALSVDQKESLGVAKRNVDRLARLINEILDFQKLDAGKMAFKMQDNDINEVIKETKEMMDIIAKEKGLDFILNLDKELPKIEFDRDKIAQVLSNLVNNSLKLTEKGSIVITTSLGNNVIKVSIKDTGPGIKEEDMHRLFQHYEQLERKTGGTGLGLAISLEIIKAHGGKIWAESIFGQGTTMYFVLPVNERRREYGK